MTAKLARAFSRYEQQKNDDKIANINETKDEDMKKILIPCLLVVAVAACAKKPDNIAAAPIPDAAYSKHTCAALNQEKINLTQSVAALSAAQESARAGDTVGVILFGLPMSSMAGGSKETDIAVAKGKLDAVERVIAQKRCR